MKTLTTLVLLAGWALVGLLAPRIDWHPIGKPCPYAMCEWQIKATFNYLEHKKPKPYVKRSRVISV
jgi:hypothetical protein